jgi:NTE family protein
MYAAWQVGVWKVLHTTVKPDMVLGASAGAWMAWAIAGGATAEDLCREWRDPRMGALMQFGIHGWGMLRPQPLHAKARELFDRYRPQIPFACTLVEIPRLRVHLVREREMTWQHLAATCSILFGYPPVKIEGRRYVDGGLRSSLPLWAAEAMGAEEAIAVNCLTSWPFRAFRAITRPRAPGPGLRVRSVEPSRPLGSLRDALVWSPRRVECWIAQGEQDAIRALHIG